MTHLQEQEATKKVKMGFRWELWINQTSSLNVMRHPSNHSNYQYQEERRKEYIWQVIKLKRM